ncbi:mycofactocin-coupled SDR family oxidoreductase [Actinomadura sp. SCN-SB]|uniref:mycofactocin-coupled SDR family oxidoreductase n=1 Tax=Actinomadura sp. SCN-SB TaxID=3373092 RepID=UPI00375257AB
MSGRVSGKVAFITGVARGQGRSHAIRLAEEGADIIGVDVPRPIDDMPYPLGTQEELDETIELVRKLGRRIVAKPADVRDRDAMRRVVDEGVAELGRLDIVVANAGICPLGPTPPGTFLDVLDVDLVGVINAYNVAYPHLPDGASMIATGSVAGLVQGTVDNPATGPGGAAYSLAKRTIAELTRDLAIALAPRRIRVNAVHPTNVDTPLLHNDPMYRQFRPDLEAPTREDAMAAFPAMQAMPIPFIEPADVSEAVLFLASDASRYVTGMQMRVDAGSVAKQMPRSL